MTHWKEVIHNLQEGRIRAAKKLDNNKWVANVDVKKAILQAFKEGQNVAHNQWGWPGFVDKDNLPARTLTPEDGVRLVPGGSSVRTGAYVASGVIVMPPAYINIGAYVDQGSMIDSHCLVGSCAQIGKNVHLSAGVQIGGVLEPIGLAPVIIEDDCFIGAGAVIVEGVQVGSGAVIAPGTVLSKSVPVYDCINNRVLEREEPIPEKAVVVPGTRPPNKKLTWALENKLSLYSSIIIKYRDDKSEKSLELEDELR